MVVIGIAPHSAAVCILHQFRKASCLHKLESHMVLFSQETKLVLWVLNKTQGIDSYFGGGSGVVVFLIRNIEGHWRWGTEQLHSHLFVIWVRTETEMPVYSFNWGL